MTHKHKNYLMKRGKTMKKFTKTFMAVAAVTAVSAAMSVSAMAMSAKYEDGTVTLTDVNSTGTSQTLLVLSKDDTVTSENVDIVKQIDQKDDSTSFASVPVGTLADGTYYVRIGGTDGSLQRATFVVGDVQPGGETKKIIVGDANLDNSINAADALFVARKAGSADTNIAQAGTEIEVVAE